MTTQSVLVDRTAAVATITMSAPALTLESKVALRDALAEVAKDPEIRAVVLAGGGKAFCVGQDLGEHSTGLDDGAEAAFATVREHYSPIVRDLLTMPKPVIAAVSGACVGAGLGFALACDYRVFASDAKLGTAFTGIGLTFDSGLSFTLPRAVGDARAKELILLGQMFSAEDGIAWGIAGETVDRDEVLDRAIALARQLAQGPTLAFAESKRLILEGSGLGLDDALEAEALAQTRCGETADHVDAVRAFLGREKPSFSGR
ncbi:enoyl-CoA hydratase [Nocardioides sp. Root190]|uniref:enoyl-CoA hydratase/isomerase family protein n=1 Tax=Nocardioides sp. Root190 TaxID=1736488 RepID=UPI0006FBF216|nr:enoyl-CoA hydratase-related protein [Nocardioides sp. Root190]KRB80095.1 enoyl-CoA hydratase [Nocardioides sp. Root190]